MIDTALVALVQGFFVGTGVYIAIKLCTKIFGPVILVWPVQKTVLAIAPPGFELPPPSEGP